MVGDRLSCWLWEMPDDPGAVVRFARARRLAEVFVNGADSAAAQQCSALRAAGVSTACLGGDPRWVLEPDRAIGWSREALRRTGCRTLHLDVEPWTLPEWPDDARRLAAAYADLVAACTVAVSGTAVEIDVVPWLFDEQPVEARRALSSASSITVLAYRDRADAILRFARPAIEAARAARRPYRIGVETMPVGPGIPSSATFADDGAAVLLREIAVLDGALADDRWFRGVAVHHWAAWRDLR